MKALGVSQFTTMPWSFEQDVERYPRHGIRTIEVCEVKLHPQLYRSQLCLLKRAGLTVASVQARVHSIFPDSLAPEPTAWEHRVEHIKRSIQRIAPGVPRNTPFVVISGAAPEGNQQLVWETCRKALRELALFADVRGATVAFEPLNPVLLNTDTAVWRLDQALRLVRRVAHPALGLCCDTWNVFQTPDLARWLKESAEHIYLVHLSDWRRPRSSADRVSLGQGSIELVPILRTLHEAGYRGPHLLEIFSDKLWQGDLGQVLHDNVTAFADLWDQAVSSRRGDGRGGSMSRAEVGSR